MSMTPAMQAEIKILPGNDRCVDCGGPHPQWASVTFGALMCLECSGAHRGMGVHISFVRSVTMDSWNEKQLALMKGGGNADLIALEEARRRPHAPQRQVPRAGERALQGPAPGQGRGQALPTQLPQRKARRLATTPGGVHVRRGFGGGDTKGAEALKGETEDQYVARQRRLQAEAASMRQVGGGMGGAGSNSDYNPATGGYGAGGGLSLGGVGDKLKGWGAAAGAGLATPARRRATTRAQQLKAKTAETAQAAWGGLRGRRALGTGKQMDGVGSGGFGGSRSGSMSGMGSQGSGFGSQGSGFGSQGSGGREPELVRDGRRRRLRPPESAQSFGSSSHHSGASNASGDLRPEPRRGPRRTRAVSAAAAAPVSRSSSAVGAGATPGKPQTPWTRTTTSSATSASDVGPP
ncbi:hypothetical protein JL720_8250 [Aureococcus anophagefferens]|nr:hypothetical protein JL720_8250 [Aureococcus anophagefferens]